MSRTTVFKKTAVACCWEDTHPGCKESAEMTEKHIDNAVVDAGMLACTQTPDADTETLNPAYVCDL